MGALGMDELGPPIAYTAVGRDTAVYDRDGDRIGVVEHVVADEAQDIFHGLIVRTPRPGQHLFARAAQVANLHERGVLLSVDRAELTEASEDPAARTVESGSEASRLRTGLRNAWDRLNQPR
jgi:sporulation protein YlmC with PRC-barrel domain